MTTLMFASSRSGALSVREFVGIFKPRIAVSIALSSVGGMAVSAGPQPAAGNAVLFTAAVFLAAGAAGAFNQWAEADLDARMARTAGRPFASGRIAPSRGWLIGIIALLAAACGLASLAANAWAAAYVFLGAFTYGVVYTLWLKRRTWLNIVVGGLAGSFAVLAGAAAVNQGLGAEPLLLALVLFLWTPPHFWSLAIAAREEYRAGAVPMLPVVLGNDVCARVILGHTLALSLLSLAPALLGMGTIYLALAAAGGALFTVTSVRLARDPTRRRAIENFLASLAQLLLLLAGAVLDRLLLG